MLLSHTTVIITPFHIGLIKLLSHTPYRNYHWGINGGSVIFFLIIKMLTVIFKEKKKKKEEKAQIIVPLI